ncbi:hypothetical protein X744_29790 [Mesorhizobium sp. LNJC372A00]|nr:hypothetical protein X745_30955 [Mesorhizobium sp. LNJC374B00]ESY52303.1 hypothetical protein X744_29790 [Mesorhizobium sp. LNJC372A00]
MKTAVETIFIGKERQYNRRFQQMCGHFLVEPVACTPASGWEKGQVENQVGLVRERFFTPRLRFKNLEELNAWLLDRCIAYARVHRHLEQGDRTVCEMFEAERGNFIPYAGRFDCFHCIPASVSKTCLVRFDNNRYSVLSSVVGRPVEIHAYADRIVIRQDGVIVGEHARSFGRSETLIRELANGTFAADQRNAVLVGGTGTGKSHLAIAIARALIRSGLHGRFYNVVDLVISWKPKPTLAAKAVLPIT